jgi:hypothetical protein
MLFTNLLAVLKIRGEISSLSYTRPSISVRRTTDAWLTFSRIGRILPVRGIRL